MQSVNQEVLSRYAPRITKPVTQHPSKTDRHPTTHHVFAPFACPRNCFQPRELAVGCLRARGLRSVVIPRRAEASTDDQVLQTVSVDDVHINRFPQQVLGDSPKPVDWIPLHPGPGRCIRRRSPSWGQRLSVVVISRRRRPGAGGGQR